MSAPVNKPFFSRRAIMFLGCVAMASLFWLLHQLSKEYTQRIKIPVTYLNIQDKQLIASDLPDSLEADVSASGFTIFTNQWTHVLSSLELDIKQARLTSNGNLALATNPSAERLEGTNGHGFRIIHVLPDTILISFSGKISKQVPVKINVNADCAPMFRIADSIAVDPGYVTLTGAPALLDKISYVSTEARSYKDLDHSVNEVLQLQLPSDMQQVSMSESSVGLRINVGKYTEARIQVPIEQQNVPSEIVWKTFPDKTDLVFLVPVEDFATVKASEFRAVVDYNSIDPSTGKVNVVIVKQPANVRDVKPKDATVEYIISK
ncbi:MAG TPA: hypothetical protein VL651_11585 [Bacteroidia bacterium]|jgi:hypothetical protein|nr:hypothetical protein [Bacteroidia bacterium]